VRISVTAAPDIRRLVEASARRQELGLSASLRLTDPQRRFLEDTRALVVLWGGNGIGKSVALAEDVRLFLLGQHPDQTAPPPVTVGLFGETWRQLGATIGYLWQRCDRRWFRDRIRYEEGHIKGQRYAIYEMISGPGKGSELHLGTFSAGAKRLAGPRYHRVVTDEPMPADIFAELWPRLLGRSGHMRIGFTPTMQTATKLDHLWSLVDDEACPWAGEIQVPLTEAAVTPRGGLVEIPWVTAEDIARFEAGTPAQIRDCRMGRSRLPMLSARYFAAWGSHLIGRPTPEVGWKVTVGVDHGSKPGAQRAVVIATGLRGGRAHVHVLGEYYADGRTTSDADGEAIVAMLRRAGIEIRDVDFWVGDRSHHGDHKGGYKSNLRLQQTIARVLGLDPVRDRQWKRSLPAPLARMTVPRKYDGSVWDGCEVLHRLMVEERLLLAPETVHLQEDLLEWRGSFIDPHKDGIDALRYATLHATQETARRAA
jgi:hypothetical protein